MKILPDGRIQVEAGDTLSGIYGANWKQLSGYTGDPTKLQIGTILPAKTATGASLAGTLPPAQVTGVTGKELPETPTDNLVLFRNLLKTVSERAGQEATATGVAGMGFEPSKVSGGTLAGIVSFIKGQKTQGIADIYKSTMDMLDTQKKQAENQLQMAISTGAISNFSDEMLERLSSMSGMPLDYLQEIRIATKTKTEAKQTDAGRITQLNQFFRDKIGEDGKVSAQDYMAAYKEWIGLDGTISDFKYAYPVEEWLGEWEYKNLPSGWRPTAEKLSFSWKGMTPTAREDIVAWMATQEGFESSDIKKMDDDSEFATYMISEYYKQY